MAEGWREAGRVKRNVRGCVEGGELAEVEGSWSISLREDKQADTSLCGCDRKRIRHQHHAHGMHACSYNVCAAECVRPCCAALDGSSQQQSTK